MEEIDSATLIIDIVIIIFSSFLFGIFAHKLKQSVIFAYIMVGILIGPHGLALISKIGEVNSLAEIGVALLMFIIGIEFKYSNIGSIWKVIIFGGIFQVTFMIGAGFGLSTYMGCSTVDSIMLGMIGSVSSTMIVVKILTERDELEELHAKLMVGLLIAQDLAVVIMVTFIINFKEIESGNVLSVAKALGYGMLAVTGIVFVGRKLLPKVMYLIVKTKSKEMFLLSIFSFAIGISVTTHLLGLSFALGAFITGFMLSEAEYNLEISTLIRPLKDIFVVIFFVSVGLFIDPRVLLANIPLALTILPLIILAKFVACAIPVWVFGYNGKTAVKVGLGLTQIGEFSFVMLTMCHQHGLLEPSTFSATIAAALFSIILTPVAINNSDRVYTFFTKTLPFGKVLKYIPHYKHAISVDDKKQVSNHVIICGCGSSGSKVANELKGKYELAIIEHDIQTFEKISAAGFKCFYGDAINHHLLIKARVATASILILSFPDIDAKKIATRYAKVYNPDIMVIARARGETEKTELHHIGVDHVIIPQSLEALDIISKVIS